MMLVDSNQRHKRVSHTIMLANDYPDFNSLSKKSSVYHHSSDSSNLTRAIARKNAHPIILNENNNSNNNIGPPEFYPENDWNNKSYDSPETDADFKYNKSPHPKNYLLRVISFFPILISVIKHFIQNKETRSIFIFLTINLAYMFIQLIYGYINNSLGLVSDAIHMFFDCIALAVGLGAAAMSKWPRNSLFPNGYGRIQVISGLINGVFLMLISVSIFCEAISRLLNPPEMRTSRLLLVSVGGLIVNLVGIFSFHDHHHGHSHDHGDDNDYGHAHSHSHSHSHDHGHDHNMEGVFLHILADTLGSVGVIVSTLLISWFGWTGFDPLASIMIAVLIFGSVIPLVKNSFLELLYRLPPARMNAVEAALGDLQSQVPAISSFPSVQFWAQSGGGGSGSGGEMFGLLEVNVSLVALHNQNQDHSHSSNSNSVVRQSIVHIQKEAQRLLEQHLGPLNDLSVHVNFE